MYRVALRVPALRARLVDGERRIALLLGAAALVAFGLAATTPVVVLVVGPLLLGVPHVAADLRYLVIRRPLSGAERAAIFGGCGLFVALRVMEMAGFQLAEVEIGLVLIWCIALMLISGGRRRRIALAVGSLVSAAPWLIIHATTVRWLFAHVHNLVAIGLWLWLFHGARRRSLAALVLIGGLALTLVLGGGTWLALAGTAAPFGVELLAASDWLVPRDISAELAAGLTCCYAFLQSIHYALWLHVIPAEEVPGRRPLGFRRSWLRARADLGSIGLIALAGAAGAVLVWGLAAPLDARASYLSLASFHGYLEIAVAGHAWTRRA